MSDDRWLRDSVDDDDLALLFTAVGDDLRKAISYAMDRAAARHSVESTLIELLELAVDEGIDDTYGSIWIALILGEIQSREAIPVLLRALGTRDEAMTDAAVDALTRLGEPGFEAVMQTVPDAQDVGFQLAAYRTLEAAGAWDHPYLREEIGDFLLERISAPDIPAEALEGAAMALARLGERRALTTLRETLEERFGKANACLRDAIEMLEENPEGIPLQTSLPSWEERLEWLSGESFRVPDSDDETARGPARRRPWRPFNAG